MALGYSQILSKYHPSAFDEWLSFLKNNFKIDLNKLLVIDNEGNRTIMSISEVSTLIKETHTLSLNVENAQKNSIFTSINFIDYLVVEYYGLDQLLTENEYDYLYSKINGRFQDFAKKKMAIGLIHDEEGYSEDYITIGR